MDNIRIAKKLIRIAEMIACGDVSVDSSYPVNNNDSNGDYNISGFEDKYEL